VWQYHKCNNYIDTYYKNTKIPTYSLMQVSVGLIILWFLCCLCVRIYDHV